MSTRHRICYTDELPLGGRRIVELQGRSIGVFNVHGEYFAVRNRCPHKGAPLCRGMVHGLMTGDDPGDFEIVRDGEILRCPWHSWEFDLRTGGSVFNPHATRVKSYDVSVEPYYAFADDPTDEDPSLETFPVSVENDADSARSMIYVHL